MFVLETIQTDGIAQLSYFLADTSSKRAVVIDPRTDVDVYLKLARDHEVAITDIFETHIHADFVSGARELQSRLEAAVIHVSGVASDYEFSARKIADGQTYEFDEFMLTARHTPGHTPEHMSFELALSDDTEQVVGVFTGDSLFAGSAGRPDLLGDDQTDALTKQLYETLYDYYLTLPDHVLIYPGHGAGSACGAGISDRLISTIGHERRHNPFLKHHNFESFYQHVVDAPHAPSHYPQLKKLNAQPRPLVAHLPVIQALPPADFRKAAREANTVVLDTRHMLAFAGGHIDSAINIGARPDLSVWVGEMFDGDEQFLLVTEDDADVPEIQRLMIRTGRFNFKGYLAGGMTAWQEAGLPLVQQPVMAARELQAALDEGRRFEVLDVRSADEYESGHIPGASHYFVADMRHRIDGLDKSRPTVVYCASGYRASLAASLMQARGFEQVYNVPGSWKAWQSIDGEVVKSDSPQTVNA